MPFWRAKSAFTKGSFCKLRVTTCYISPNIYPGPYLTTWYSCTSSGTFFSRLAFWVTFLSVSEFKMDLYPFDFALSFPPFLDWFLISSRNSLFFLFSSIWGGWALFLTTSFYTASNSPAYTKYMDSSGLSSHFLFSSSALFSCGSWSASSTSRLLACLFNMLSVV